MTPESSSTQPRGNTLNASCPGYTCLQPFSREGTATHRKEAQPAGSNTVASLISQWLSPPARESDFTAHPSPNMGFAAVPRGLSPCSTSKQDATEVCRLATGISLPAHTQPCCSLLSPRDSTFWPELQGKLCQPHMAFLSALSEDHRKDHEYRLTLQCSLSRPGPGKAEMGPAPCPSPT